MYEKQIKEAFKLANKIAKENPDSGQPEFSTVEAYKNFLIFRALKDEKDYFEQKYCLSFEL